MFIDSHAHLDAPDFDLDRSVILDRARAAQVERILAIGSGTGTGGLDGALKLAEKYEDLDASIGIHPHDARLATPADFELLKSWVTHPKLVAWGEIGLDHHYGHSSRGIQMEVFVRQLELAADAELPVIIHTRDAERETLQALSGQFSKKPVRGVMHCFSGSMEFAMQCLELGFLISFSGIITFPKAHNVRKVAQQVPLDRLLVETDSPYLTPVPYRGRRNEPAFVTLTAETLAHQKNVSLEDLALQTCRNYRDLFHRRSHVAEE